MATVRELLDVGVARLRESGSESARLDAEVLLAHALDTDRTGVIAHTDAPVGDGIVARYQAALDRRATGEPVAYIRGFKEFHGLAFAVDARALIPRPETERLVELTELEVVRRLTGAPRPPGAPPIRVIDVGVGSGAVAVTARGPASPPRDGRRGRDHGHGRRRGRPPAREGERRGACRRRPDQLPDIGPAARVRPTTLGRRYGEPAVRPVRRHPELATSRGLRAGRARSTAAPMGSR